MISILKTARFRPLRGLSLLLGATFFGLAFPALADDKGEGSTEASSIVDSDSTPRPQTPPNPPNPEELDLKPDDQGKVRFSFQGQPWLGVLEWLAQTSSLSLDWQEVPTGYLNLRTQQSYSIEEARDLINRHLLDRGFTLLKHGEILSVVKVRNLDPSLVPRLEPEELLEARPHDFVRVSFPLEWMTAEAAIEDLKPLISPNGKLTAIKSTNRLETIDAVANLRDIQKMLSDPQSPRGPRRMVREFRLEHVKAADVQGHLTKLLGLEKASPNSGDPTAIMQQMAKIMKEAGVAPGQGGGQKQQQGPQVHLVANVRDNSILAHAPADQMAIIAEAIEVMDHPSDKTRSVLRNSQRVQVYPLNVAEPEAVLKMLQDLADLSPDTRLQVDKKNRSIVAHANLADHLTIRTLVDKLDGTVRKFRVIPLSRLDADFVAGSIDLVMGGGEATKRPAGRDPEDEARRFRVVADVERNRLLLWVNDDEFADVERLLAELGDGPNAVEREATVRVIETPDPAQAEELIRKLEQAWPGLAPNALELGPGVKTDKAERPAKRPDARSLRNAPSTTPPLASPPERDRRTGRIDCEPEAERMRLVRLTSGADEPANGGPADVEPVADLKQQAPKEFEPKRVQANKLASAIESRPESPELPDSPAVRLERDAEGRLIAASQDPAAVELVQKLINELGPRAKGFRVFRMKHKTTWASSIAQNLQTFFEERQKAEEKRRNEVANTSRWYDPNGGKWINSPRAEAERKKQIAAPPKFIVDSDTNSILAVGANDEQLKAIEELIEVYDTAEAQEPHPTRVTRLVPVKYGQVRQIAETVKDVYRDLISSDSSSSSQRRRWFDPTFTVAYTGKGGETLVKYRGQLAISSDETSSSVVISAPEGLIDSVEATIKALDDASLASRPRVQVVKINRGVDPNEVQRKLMQAINKR